MRPQLSKLCCS